MHKAYNIQFAYPIMPDEAGHILRKVERVPNTYVRIEDREVFLLHFPVVYGMIEEDPEIERAWDELCITL